MDLIQLTDMAPEDRLMGACCTLDAAEMPARLKEWSDLRDRSLAIKPIQGGVSIELATSEPMSQVADLIARESECCAFYTFLLRVDGPARELEISAGDGREVAVQVLLGYRRFPENRWTWTPGCASGTSSALLSGSVGD